MSKAEENCNLQRDIFDTKVKMIIANAKYNENKQELDRLKKDLRIASCEIIELKSANSNLEYRLTQLQLNKNPDNDWNEKELTDADQSYTSSRSVAKSFKSSSGVSSSASYVKSNKKTFDSSDLHLFVGHLGTETDEASLKKYFSRFGEIEDVHVPRNASGENRRFGYVTFNHFFDKSPLYQRHNIDGSSVYMDKVARYQEVAKSETIVVSGKIGEVPTDELHRHFSKFGNIVDINRQLERGGKFKRFAVIIFDNSEEVDRVVSQNEHIVGGQIVDCKRAKNR